jgi:Brp/Blh family beta-carotene 15,15'-monooxygenase
LSAAIVVIVTAVLGVPHGAVDHLVVAELDGRCGRGSRRRLLRNYVLAAGGVGLVWLAVAPLALAAFLLASVHHFGQSDLAHLRLPMPHQLALQWSRGLFLVGLPLVAHVAAVSAVVDHLGAGGPAGWPWLAQLSWLWCTVLVLQHVAVGVLIARATDRWDIVGGEAVTVAVLTLLFLTADPLIGFAVYFGLWHSLAHLFVLADVLGAGPSRIRSLARLATPLTAVALVALGAVGAATALAGGIDLVVPAILVFVSMLTFPHLVVVEQLWRQAPQPKGAVRDLAASTSDGPGG